MAHGRHRATQGVARQVIATGLLILAVVGAFTVTHKFVHLTVVHGISMNPTYVTGDLIVSVNTGGFKRGDVITYHPQGLPCDLCNVVHRIVGGNASTGWITKGDNNANIDPWKPVAENILGKSVLHIAMPKPLQILYLPQLWLLILAIIGTGYAWRHFINMVSKEKEDAKVALT